MASSDDLVGMKCATGIRNPEYGVWKSRCCGDEIVLYPGSVLPLCHRHKDEPTEWVLISTNPFTKRRNPPEDGASGLHIPLSRLQHLSTQGVVSNEDECIHLTKCVVCRSQLQKLARDYHRRFFTDSDRWKSA